MDGDTLHQFFDKAMPEILSFVQQWKPSLNLNVRVKELGPHVQLQKCLELLSKFERNKLKVNETDIDSQGLLAKMIKSKL